MANRVVRKMRLWLLNSGSGVDLEDLDLRCLAFRTSSTVTTELGATFLTDYTSLAECDAGGYARAPLATVALVEDAPSDELRLTADPTDLGTVTGGSEPIAGFLVYVHIGADSANRPFAIATDFASGPGLPYTPFGQPLIVHWDAEGVAVF